VVESEYLHINSEILVWFLHNLLQKNVYDGKTRTPGTARHLIVTVEQLFKSREGHFPRLFLLLRDQRFSKLVVRFNVDEAHHIHTAGLSLYGLEPFRPAWGRLGELKALLSNKVRWHCFSATFAPHILKTVEAKLLQSSYELIKLTSNRPNTIYATHRVINSIDDLRNYACFLLPKRDFSLVAQPRVLIFVDNRTLTDRIARFLNLLLPEHYQNKGVVRHYHSLMSELYLQRAHKDFTDPNGAGPIMIATANQSVVSRFIVSSMSNGLNFCRELTSTRWQLSVLLAFRVRPSILFNVVAVPIETLIGLLYLSTFTIPGSMKYPSMNTNMEIPWTLTARELCLNLPQRDATEHHIRQSSS